MKETPQLRLLGWAFYDFANTIFSAVVLTFYFPLYLTSLTHRNLNLGIATSTAMVLAAVAVPWLGALSDRTGKTKFYLICTTFFCIVFTVLLSFENSTLTLMADFLVACFFFHASLVFYNALLPVVTEPGKQGLASGLGTGLGYLGVLFAIPIAHVIDYLLGRRWVFAGAGILFLIFSVPLFLWVPERKVPNPAPFSFKILMESWQKVFRLAASLLERRNVALFFLGNFFVVEAMNAIIFWLVVYVSRVFEPNQTVLVTTFLSLNFSAFLFGVIAGLLTDKWGAHKTLLTASGALCLTLLVLALAQNFPLFVTASLLGGGFAFSGIWTGGRKRVLEFAPAGEEGEYFGFYNLTTKISVVFSLVFSLLADHFGFRAALASLILPSALGFCLLWFSSEAI